MVISLSFKNKTTVFSYLWSLAIIGLIYICAVSFSQAQIGTTCDTTAIYQPGHGWVQGSEQTTCTPVFTNPHDGFIGNGDDGPCGSGGCPEAPIDEDEGLTEEQECQIEQAKESEDDRLAGEIADVIRARNTASSNPDNVEGGAFILQLNDNTHVRVRVRYGSTGAVSLRTMYSEARRGYPGIDASNIVAIVHSHPREAGPGFEDVSNINDLSALDFGNTMPSHPNIAAGPNDWDNGRNFLLANGRTSVADVSHYILGPDGVLRQYNYSDGHPAESTEQQQLINNAAENAAGNCDEISN